ncbi:hypothetical protein [Xenorhabdus szentirmaii]|uniref:Uncharacterized protein n=1 Tax=Xenorhabdus szentirmaii DSM 16338 TaxID=1427518 RepID=W1J1V2_9GAMM|nr:hypothetical protein [Xenorhabdus szentirmaii]PHM32053.1 hypothetical protein Xsze_02782 [Xenorhabdus szentirmaii DSM 16338]CDL83856.1 hypothetical protein XSR1_380020 [Xenorhabdus szentirmaii DSM 16338]
MGQIHFVNIDKIGFDIIKDNKNHCIGVDTGCDKRIDLNDAERISQFFIIKSVGIENIFSQKTLPTSTSKGDFILFSLVGENDRVDNTFPRITIRINEIHHFHSSLDSLLEINFSFYEYSLLAPEYFCYEGAGNGK